jgi:uncharacterized protein (TIGR00255 family)
MKSMTGYAYIEENLGERAVSVEIRGYNNRFLETCIQLPPSMNAAESHVREATASKCTRGKVEIHIRVKGANNAAQIHVNKEAALAYKNALSQLSNFLEIKEEITLSDLMKCDNLFESNNETTGSDEAWAIIKPPLLSALNRFEIEKKREGAHTEKDIMAFLSKMEDAAIAIKQLAGAEDERMKKAIKDRFAEIAGTVIDENRLLSEAALLVMKYTISEELSRLSAHFAEFWADVKSSENPGKKLDFLCQEINREINTIGAKSQSLEIIRHVVDIKENLENIREQLRNIE